MVGLALVLVSIALLVYANTLTHPFVHDDLVFIQLNPQIGRLDNLLDVFVPAKADPALAGLPGVNTYYRPLLEVLYRLQYAVFGFQPSGWHVINALVHGANGVLVWQVLIRLGLSSRLAWMAALIFLIHPVQTESVNSIAGQSNLWMALGVLAALYFYLRQELWASSAAFVLALLCKEQAIMLMGLIVLSDAHRRKGLTRGALILLGVALTYLLVRHTVTGSNILRDILASPGELKLRLLTVPQVLLTYVRLLAAPFDLHYYRCTDILVVHYWAWPAAGLLFWTGWRLGGWVRFSTVWLVLALLPVLNVVPLVNEYSLILTAEHFLYIPMIGFAVAAVLALERVFRQRLEWVMLALAGVLSCMTVQQNRVWASEVAIFKNTVQHEPHFGRGHLLLAKALYFQQQLAEADVHFARAFEIMDGYSRKAVGEAPRHFYAGFKKGILFDWAHSLEDGGKLPEAKAKYEEALSIDGQDPVLWNNLGVLCVKMGQVAEAARHFRRALELAPEFAPARQNLNQLKI